MFNMCIFKMKLKAKFIITHDISLNHDISQKNQDKSADRLIRSTNMQFFHSRA